MLGHKKLHKSDPVIHMSFQFHVSDKKYNLGSEFLKEDAKIEPRSWTDKRVQKFWFVDVENVKNNEYSTC